MANVSGSGAGFLNSIDAKLLFSRNDPKDQRLGDLVHTLTETANTDELKTKLDKIHGFSVVGYPDDEGIRLNGGRIGAKEAPDRIRNFLYRMTPPAFLGDQTVSISDLGNIVCEGRNLEARHEVARQTQLEVQSRGLKGISFGGGHDFGFSDASAYCEHAVKRGERPLVINFDAHLDVRPMDKGPTSGTPFFRLLEKFPEIDFVELGLQSQCNSKAHVDWLVSRGGLVSFEEERKAKRLSLTETLLGLLGDRALSKRSAFLSIDIDGFSSSVAPGASQSWPTGFETGDFFDCFSWCLHRFDVRAIGIYEVSPALDVDDRTSRLAALIAHRYVFQL